MGSRLMPFTVGSCHGSLPASWTFIADAAHNDTINIQAKNVRETLLIVIKNIRVVLKI